MITTLTTITRSLRALAIPVAVLVATPLLASEARADPYWGEFSPGDCVNDHQQIYSAVLWDIPWGQSWENACWSMDATLDGTYYPEPDNCVNTALNMWGEFYVENPDCIEAGLPPLCWLEEPLVVCSCESPLTHLHRESCGQL